MARSLSSVAVEFVAAESQVRSEFTCPVFLWEGAAVADALAAFDTQAPPKVSRPQEGDALIFPLRKRPRRTDAFPQGITLGSAANCDITLPDESVGALHAYVVEAPSGWQLVDADSKEGVRVNGQRIPRRVPTLIPDGATVSLGEVTLQFLLPAGLMKYLAAVV